MKNKRPIQTIKNCLASGSLIATAISSLTFITSARADQQIQDDLVVTGSICAGFDCVNGEAFNFDTIRLKENNLRIKFIDTSSSSSFPTVDWEIVVNESVNGGLNKFSIAEKDSGNTPFTILQSAPNNSIFVTASGNVGFGTSAPLVEMQIQDGNSPALRLHQDGSSGFAEQVWDVSGNETNFFIRDVTNNGLLPLRISPGAPNSSIHVAADGDVGFETSTPDGQFDVAHNDNANNHAFLISPVSEVGVNIDNGFIPRGPFDVQTTGGVSRFMVQRDGKVGIGLSTSGTATGLFDVQLAGISKLRVAIDGKVEAIGKLEATGELEAIGTNWAGGPADPNDAAYLGTPQSVILGVKNADNTSHFQVTNAGNVGIGTITPYFPLEVARTGTGAVIAVTRTDGAQAALSASGNFGIVGTRTDHPFRLRVNNLEVMTLNTDKSVSMGTGASHSAGGVWIDASSREYKDNIKKLEGDRALKAFRELTPVTYNYKVNEKEGHVGFIAEDVPELVAQNDRKGLNAMNIVALLTKVVQEQQKTITKMGYEFAEMRNRVAKLQGK